MPAMVAVGRPDGEGETWGVADGKGGVEVVGGRRRVAVVVRVTVVGGWEVRVKVEVMVMVDSAWRTLCKGQTGQLWVSVGRRGSLGNGPGIGLIDGRHVGGRSMCRDNDGRNAGDIGCLREVGGGCKSSSWSVLARSRSNIAAETCKTWDRQQTGGGPLDHCGPGDPDNVCLYCCSRDGDKDGGDEGRRFDFSYDDGGPLGCSLGEGLDDGRRDRHRLPFSRSTWRP